MMGPGKYDKLCGLARRKAHADAAILMIFNGDKGSGFSVVSEAGMLAHIPALLERVAAEIRADLAPHNLSS